MRVNRTPDVKQDGDRVHPRPADRRRENLRRRSALTHPVQNAVAVHIAWMAAYEPLGLRLPDRTSSDQSGTTSHIDARRGSVPLTGSLGSCERMRLRFALSGP